MPLTLSACGSGTVASVPRDTNLDRGTDAATSGSNADGGDGATAFTGTLGKLGVAKATVASLFIENSGETLIYLSSTPITCTQLTVSRWLGSVEPGAQVVEIVVKGTPKVGQIAVPPAEVNYSEGGKSSAYEVNAESGNVTFTKTEAKGVVAGNFTASYGDGSAIEGSFHAAFCDGGQGY
jgi:hypothetical protein